MAKIYLRDFCKSESQPEVAQLDWECAPVGISFPSSALELSNFDTLQDRLDEVDPYASNWEILYFPNTEVKWLGQIFVKPDTDCARICDDIRLKMAAYPSLDDDRWVEYEAGETRQKKNSK